MLQANRRFQEIEGKHLALVISVSLFVAVTPLLITGLDVSATARPAYAQAFSLAHPGGPGPAALHGALGILGSVNGLPFGRSLRGAKSTQLIARVIQSAESSDPG